MGLRIDARGLGTGKGQLRLVSGGTATLRPYLGVGKTGPQGPAGPSSLIDDPDRPHTARVVTGTDLAMPFIACARNPDSILAGAITRDANGAATSAGVVWPDGTVGTYTADTVSTAFPGAVDAYHITYGDPVAVTYTQPAVTRDPASGAVTVAPAIVVTEA